MLDESLDLCYARISIGGGFHKFWMPTMSRNLTLLWLSISVTLVSLLSPMVLESHAGPLDQLTDLSGKATVVVTLKGRDNFNSEYLYDVSVKNLSPDTFIGDSLFLVLDKVTNIGGEER